MCVCMAVLQLQVLLIENCLSVSSSAAVVVDSPLNAITVSEGPLLSLLKKGVWSVPEAACFRPSLLSLHPQISTVEGCEKEKDTPDAAFTLPSWEASQV